MAKKKIERPDEDEPCTTHEATAYIGGLFDEFRQQARRYSQLTGHLLSLEARIELAEKTLCLTRDHLRMTIAQTDTAAPRDWEPTFQSVRFVGVRLVDACIALLQEHKKLTQEKLLNLLNAGMFRFRTSSPPREIHAALLRQHQIKKTGDTWIWIGGGEQMRMKLRAVENENVKEVK